MLFLFTVMIKSLLRRLGQPVDARLCDLKILVGTASANADRAKQEIVLVKRQAATKDDQAAVSLLNAWWIVSM